ncbi:MAG: hypothetical protein GF346_09185 [Candidatus Eisenbacteria bacterium]|nr:hypothetical protein [Candidatus Latescibacterota bacterium]MBD3302604.1 hypothetical protein [Candidatus Eisenbacteria bacterium]
MKRRTNLLILWLHGIVLGTILGLTGCELFSEGENRVTVPQGQSFVVALRNGLDTATNRPGDPILGRISQSVRVEGHLVPPRGSLMRGTLVHIRGADRPEGRAGMTLLFEEIETPDGARHEVETEALELIARSRVYNDARRAIGDGYAQATAGGNRFASSRPSAERVIGTTTRAAIFVTTTDDEIRLDPGQRLVVRLQESVDLPVSRTGTPSSSRR